MKRKGKASKNPSQPAATANANPPLMGEKLRWAALVILLCVTCGRLFIAELPFRLQPVDKSVLAGQFDINNSLPPVSMLELARVWFPVAIFFAGGFWLAGELRRKNLKISGISGGVIALIFVVTSLASCFVASDRRSAEMVWLEQFAMIFGGFVVMQLCRCRRRLAVTLVVLAALGATMGVKGLYEKAVEIPDRISFFQENKEKSLKEQGMTPGSSSAIMFEARLMNTTPTGYISLSNIFGSSLLLLLPAVAAAGAGIVRRAIAQKKSGEFDAGQIPPATLAGGLGLLLAAITAVVLVWTRSRGAIGAAAAMLVLLGVLWPFRGALRRRFAVSVIVGVLAFVALVGAVTMYGVKHDSLIMKTMTFRWFYWTGGAEMLKTHWPAGVGGGNFGDAYLQVRRPEAEEEVKMPHNFIIHSLTQFGVFAGGAYIVLVGITVAGAWRSVARASGDFEFDINAKRVGQLIIVLMLTVLLARWFFAGMAGLLFILEALMPAMLLGAMVWLFAWQFRKLPMWACSLALAAGVSAFVLQNMVEDGLWMPGTATLFWLTAGAACAAGGRAVEFRRGMSASLLIWAVIFGVLLVWIVRPVTRRMFYTRDLGYGLMGDGKGLDSARLAANADPLDYIAAGNVASLNMIYANSAYANAKNIYQSQVLPWLKESQRRNPQNSQSAYSLILTKSYCIVPGDKTAVDELLNDIDAAAKLNPSDAEFMLRLAAVCNFVRQDKKRDELIARARELNEQLRKFNPTSPCILPQGRFRNTEEHGFSLPQFFE